MFLESESQIMNVVGVDEVGRGPLAGPVVSCAFSYEGLSEDFLDDIQKLEELAVTDSKKLSAKKRQRILTELSIDKMSVNKVHTLSTLKGECAYVLQVSDEQRIEELNILHASLDAMKRCVVSLDLKPDAHVWIDGNKKPPGLDHYQLQTIIKGDEKSFSIGLASIIAKEYRDQLMAEYARSYPHYAFEKNAGYPTKAHKEALIKYGVTPIHRKSFKGVKELLSTRFEA